MKVTITVLLEIFSTLLIPDRIFYRERVKEVVLPTLTGQMGVLRGHIPILTGLDVGLLLLRRDYGDSWVPFVVTGGFALVSNDNVTILVNEAELGSVWFVITFI